MAKTWNASEPLSFFRTFHTEAEFRTWVGDNRPNSCRSNSQQVPFFRQDDPDNYDFLKENNLCPKDIPKRYPAVLSAYRSGGAPHIVGYVYPRDFERTESEKDL